MNKESPVKELLGDFTTELAEYIHQNVIHDHGAMAALHDHINTFRCEFIKTKSVYIALIEKGFSPKEVKERGIRKVKELIEKYSINNQP